MAEPEETRKKEPWEQTIGEIFGTSTDADVGGANNDGEKHPSGKNVRLTNHAEVAPVFATRIAEALSSTVLRVVGVSSNKPKSKPEDGGKDGDSIWRRMESWADEQKRDFDQFSWASVFDRSKTDGDRKNESIQDSVSSQLGVRVDNLNESYSNADDEEERGSYREEKSAKTWLNTFYNDIRTNKFFKPLDKIASGMASVVRGIASIGKGIMNLAAGIVNIFAHPIKTIKNIAATFIGAIGTVAGFLSSALPVILGIAAIGGTLFGIEKLTNVESRRGLLMRIGAKEEDGKYTSEGVGQENMDLFNMIVDDQGRMKSTSDIGFVGSMKILWKNFLFESSEFLIKKAVPFGKAIGEAFYDVLVKKLPGFVSDLWAQIMYAREHEAEIRAEKINLAFVNERALDVHAMTGTHNTYYDPGGWFGIGSGIKVGEWTQERKEFAKNWKEATKTNPAAAGEDLELWVAQLARHWEKSQEGDENAIRAVKQATGHIRIARLAEEIAKGFNEGTKVEKLHKAWRMVLQSVGPTKRAEFEKLSEESETEFSKRIKYATEKREQVGRLEILEENTTPNEPPEIIIRPASSNSETNGGRAVKDDAATVSVSRNPVSTWETATVEMGVRSVLSGGGFVPIA